MSEDATQKLKKCYFKLWLVLLAIVIAVGAYWFWYEAPFKVKDPSDPRFNPDRFSFRDYKTQSEMKRAFSSLFPVGSSKSYVDSVLLGAGKGRLVKVYDFSECGPQYSRAVYTEPTNYLRSIKGAINHDFYFDKNMTVMNIEVFFHHIVFDDAVHPETLKNNQYKACEQERLDD